MPCTGACAWESVSPPTLASSAATSPSLTLQTGSVQDTVAVASMSRTKLSPERCSRSVWASWSRTCKRIIPVWKVRFTPLSPHDSLKHHFKFLKKIDFPSFRRKTTMKLFHQYMAFFFTFSSTLSHLHPLQVGNCGSNSRRKFRLERVKAKTFWKVIQVNHHSKHKTFV